MAEHSYLQSLIKRASDLKVAQDPTWHALLHYKRQNFGQGVQSSAESEFFFLHPKGASDPELELIETLKSFFKTEERLEPDGQHQPFHCAFMARYSWLKTKLGIDELQLPFQNCERFSSWYGAIDPMGVTLIFPSSFLNNPASAFGHTLLRIDRMGQTEDTSYLSYTANYAAATMGEGALTYAFKGIFGGYPGFFSVAPYHEKVKKYSDFESRDIWEYPLTLTREEVSLLVKHLWELRGVAFSYYYFDENCSYQLLSLIDVARPSLNLAREFSTWVIPIDTVKLIFSKPGLAGEGVFRPSLISKLNARIESTGRRERDLVSQVIESGVNAIEQGSHSISEESLAEVYDLSYEFLNYKIVSGKDEDLLLQRRAFEVLRARSALGPAPELRLTPPTVSPKDGHNTFRFGNGLVHEEGGVNSYGIRVRAAYHDLLDPSPGFLRGSEIELLDLDLRVAESGATYLDRVDFISAKSLSVRNEFIRPISWELNIGGERSRIGSSNHIFSPFLKGGAGYAWEISPKDITFGLLTGELSANTRFADNYSFGVGPKVGTLVQVLPNWNALFSISSTRSLGGDEFWKTEIHLAQGMSLDKNVSLRPEISLRKSFSESDTTVSVF